MDGKFQTSFIPKKPLEQTGARPVHRMSFFSLIAMVIFITTLIIAGLVYGYKYYITSQIKSAQATLKSQLEKFEPSRVAVLSRLDNQIESAKELLSNHLALSAFFDFLGANTLRSVRFSSFTYTAQPGQKITVAMDGQAQSFSSVALQATEMSKSENQKYLREPLFSNLNLDKSGNVTFTFTATIDPKLIDYTALVNAANTSLSASPVISTGSTTQTQAATGTPATASSTNTRR